MNKKAFIFTSIVLIVLTLFFLSFTLRSPDAEKTTKKRVETLDSLSKSLKKDMERNIYIAGYRTIFILEKKIVQTGTPISSVELAAEELFLNGTLNNNPEELMQGITFSEITSSLNLLAQKQNAQLQLQSPVFTISQSDPWHLNISLSISFNLSDNAKNAFWYTQETISSYIDIEHFEDPLYVIKTQGKITNNITRTPYTAFVSDNNISNLNDHIINSYYLASSDAPSFIDRLEGKTTPNPNGIESLVNLQKFSQQEASVLDKAIIDHIYFSSSNPTAHQIQSLPSWAKVDDAHLSTYQVEGLTIN